MSKFTFQIYTTLAELDELQAAWEALHHEAVLATPYNSFDFIHASTLAFCEPDTQPHVLSVHHKGKLIALFPFQSVLLEYHGAKLKVLEYAAQSEIDKPYPIILSGHEELAWEALVKYLKDSPHDWHRIDLMEMRDELPGVQILANSLAKPWYLARRKVDRKSPLVDLTQPWEERWQAHKKMRKKVRRMENAYAERFSFEVCNKPYNWRKWLDAYIAIESKGWKAGRVGIGKSAESRAFYEDFFARLSSNGKLHFGVLAVDNEPVSIEIAYTERDTVYFSHGTFDEAFATYSPGMVSTCLLLRHFHESSFKVGDYLAGYAGYMVPWADQLLPSSRLMAYRVSPAVLYTLGTKLVERLDLFKRQRKAHADANDKAAAKL